MVGQVVHGVERRVHTWNMPEPVVSLCPLHGCYKGPRYVHGEDLQQAGQMSVLIFFFMAGQCCQTEIGIPLCCHKIIRGQYLVPLLCCCIACFAKHSAILISQPFKLLLPLSQINFRHSNYVVDSLVKNFFLTAARKLSGSLQQ